MKNFFIREASDRREGRERERKREREREREKERKRERGRKGKERISSSYRKRSCDAANQTQHLSIDKMG